MPRFIRAGEGLCSNQSVREPLRHETQQINKIRKTRTKQCSAKVPSQAQPGFPQDPNGRRVGAIVDISTKLSAMNGVRWKLPSIRFTSVNRAAVRPVVARGFSYKRPQLSNSGGRIFIPRASHYSSGTRKLASRIVRGAPLTPSLCCISRWYQRRVVSIAKKTLPTTPCRRIHVPRCRLVLPRLLRLPCAARNTHNG